MKSKKVISHKNMPARLPIFQTITTLLALEHWNAPQWLWGAIGLFYLIVWCIGIYLVCTQEEIEIIKNEKE